MRDRGRLDLTTSVQFHTHLTKPTHGARNRLIRRMKRTQRSHLTERWRSLEGRDLAAKASRWLAGFGELPEAIPEIEGRVDLRCLEVSRSLGPESTSPSKPSLEGAEFVNTSWVGVDLRRCHPALRLPSHRTGIVETG